MKTLLQALLLTFLFVMSARLISMAQPGALDPSFNGSGYAVDTTGGINKYGFTLAIHPDFKTTVSALVYTTDGYIARLIRYNADGSLDQSFGDGGYKNIDFNNLTFITGLALQPDGKIVATGTTSEGGKVICTTVRLNPDGSYDNDFGQNGIVMTQGMDSLEYTSDVKVLSDGKLLVSGRLANQNDNQLFIIRYLASGIIDTAFGIGGIATKTVPGGRLNNFGRMSLTNDGKIVLGGQVVFGTSWSGIALFRLSEDGSTDNTFGINGMVVDTAAYKKGLYSLITQPDGRIVVPTWVYLDATHYHYALIRYNADGSRDQTFANNGLYTGPGGFAYGVALQTDGKILTAGGLKNDSTVLHATVARILPSGIPDSAFGNNGFFEFNDSLPSGFWDIRTDPAERSISTGYCNLRTNPSRKDILTVRLNAFPVGLPETSTEQTITIRPNPFNNYVTIETPGTSGSVIELFSIRGQHVETLRMEGEKGTFNLGHLPAGSYFLRNSGALHSVTKVMKVN